jgi:hypothetical protein
VALAIDLRMRAEQLAQQGGSCSRQAGDADKSCSHDGDEVLLVLA